MLFHNSMDAKLNLNHRLLIPVRRCRRTGGVFVWPDQVTLVSPRACDALPLRRLRRTLKRLLGVRGRVVRSVMAPAASDLGSGIWDCQGHGNWPFDKLRTGNWVLAIRDGTRHYGLTA